MLFNLGVRAKYWYAAFVGPDGKRNFKSTKTTDKRLALKLAIEWEDLSNAGKRGMLVASQARKVVSEIAERATGEPLQFKTASEFLNAWLAGREGAKATSTVLKYKQAVREFIAHLDKRALMPMNAIRSSDITAYRDHCKSLGLESSSINNFMKCLFAAFESA